MVGDKWDPSPICGSNIRLCYMAPSSRQPNRTHLRAGLSRECPVARDQRAQGQLEPRQCPAYCRAWSSTFQNVTCAAISIAARRQ